MNSDRVSELEKELIIWSNFEKACWRLNAIIDLIYCEIESRKQ